MFLDPDQPDDYIPISNLSIKNAVWYDDDNRMIIFSGIECDAIELAEAMQDPVKHAEVMNAMHTALTRHIEYGQRALERIKSKARANDDGQPTGNSQD